MSKHFTLIIIVSTLLIALLTVVVISRNLPTPAVDLPTPVETPTTITIPWSEKIVIGQSVEGRSITATRFGTGDTHLLFVGGIHGGYEWNSSLLAYQMSDYLALNPGEVPESITIHIIPDLNPDGTFAVTGVVGKFDLRNIPDPSTRVAAARFNANSVDLNRNFACKWAPESSWRGQVVSAGTAAFSEPEAIALRDYVITINPAAAIFWHSQASNVYASECEDGILPETLTLMNTYADAASYGAVASFDAYPITGDAEGWLASIGIPAVTVELESASDIEWERNLAGLMAVTDYYSRVTR